nr:O-antigen ligase family protein [Sedimentibacter sp.]
MGVGTSNNIKRIQNNEDDRKISIALMASFVILTIQYLVLIYFNLIATSIGSSIQLLSKGLVGLIYIYALPTALKRSLNKFLKVYLIAVFIFLLHYLIFPENREYIIDLLFPFFFTSLPAFIYALSIRDFGVLKSIMKKASYIVFVFGLFLGLVIFLGRSSVGVYSMSLSYYMLLPAIMFLDELLDELSLKTLLFTVLSLIIILALGSRGAILCVVVFVLLKFIRPNSKRTYKRAIGHFSLFGLGILAFIFFEQIIMNIYNFLLRFGISSRTLILFLRDEVSLSGRDRIYETIIKEITGNPIVGIGIAGDRPLFTSGYVHNIFFEILADFGIILGFFLSLGIILLTIKSLFIKDRAKYNLVIIWISLGFVHLMVSSSYLIDIKFWILLGLMINILKEKKQDKHEVLHK